MVLRRRFAFLVAGAARGGGCRGASPSALSARRTWGVAQELGQVGPAELPPKRLQTYRLAQFQAGRQGLPLRFPPRHPFRSLDVLRLLAATDEPAPSVVRQAFEFVWREGRDPSDPAELGVLAARLDHPDPDAGRDRLRRWTEEAAQHGVFGVPTLQIGAELFWGADAMPLAEAYLADRDILTRGEMARLGILPVGVTRRP